MNYLPKESKIEFHESVDRDSVNSKISGLIEKADDIIDICKHEENLAIFFSHNKFLAIFANYVMLWKDLAFLLTLGINILIILSFYEGDEGDEDVISNKFIIISKNIMIEFTIRDFLKQFYLQKKQKKCLSFVVLL